MTGLLLVLFFAGALLLSIPIAFALAISTVLVIFITDIIPINLVVQTYFTSADSFPLLAIPFFILAGDIMMAGGISKRLVNFSTKMLGGVTGALGIITVFTCMIFAAISGSAIATVAAIGGIMIPAMIKENYDKGFATSLAAASGSLGPIIPPSLTFIIYGIVAGVSITDLF
ncbi:MAG: TRAP transporter large permease subunit, partial [Clostridia bacterium]|nr:TRAP transporter large permease subunit [Clostridia bacterium]